MEPTEVTLTDHQTAMASSKVISGAGSTSLPVSEEGNGEERRVKRPIREILEDYMDDMITFSDQPELLVMFPNFPCDVDWQDQSHVKYLQDALDLISVTASTRTAHPDEVSREDLEEMIGEAESLMQFFDCIKEKGSFCESFLGSIKCHKEELEETLSNPRICKFSGDEIFFHHDDANYLSERCRGFTPTPDNSDEEEEEEDNETSLSVPAAAVVAAPPVSSSSSAAVAVAADNVADDDDDLPILRPGVKCGNGGSKKRALVVAAANQQHSPPKKVAKNDGSSTKAAILIKDEDDDDLPILRPSSRTKGGSKK